MKNVNRVGDCTLVWWRDECPQESRDVSVLPSRLDGQTQLLERHSLDLGQRLCSHARFDVVCEQFIAISCSYTASTASPLLACSLGCPDLLQPDDVVRYVIICFFHSTCIYNRNHILDRDRSLGDVGGSDDFSFANRCGWKDFLLLGRQQGSMQRECNNVRNRGKRADTTIDLEGSWQEY